MKSAVMMNAIAHEIFSPVCSVVRIGGAGVNSQGHIFFRLG
jgi:hypothetical protein